VVGGVLEANGFPEALSNLQEAASEFDASFDELAALAEVAVRRGPPFVVDSNTPVDANRGAHLSEWETCFRTARVVGERLEAAKSQRGKTTLMGNFLSPMIDRTVPVVGNGRTGMATLAREEVRSRLRLYYFRVEWDLQPDQ
jgi:hypothetical protein